MTQYVCVIIQSNVVGINYKMLGKEKHIDHWIVIMTYGCVFYVKYIYVVLQRLVGINNIKINFF